MSEVNSPDQATNKRERSPSFPYIDLGVCIEHLEKLYEAAKMNEVRVADVAPAWGMTAKSGSLMRYVAAMGQFGLVDASGSGDNRRIKVSSDGRRILEDDRPGIREKLCSDAALKPKLMNGLFLGSEGTPHWGRNRPSDSIAESALKFDLSFTADAARRFLSVYDATIPYILEEQKSPEEVRVQDNVVEEEQPSPAIVEALASPKFTVGALINWESGGQIQWSDPRAVLSIDRHEDGSFYYKVSGPPDDAEAFGWIPEPEVVFAEEKTKAASNFKPPPPPAVKPDATEGESPKKGQRKAVFPVSDGDVTFLFPEGLTLDGIEELEAYLAVFLKKEKRSAQPS